MGDEICSEPDARGSIRRVAVQRHARNRIRRGLHDVGLGRSLDVGLDDVTGIVSHKIVDDLADVTVRIAGGTDSFRKVREMRDADTTTGCDLALITTDLTSPAEAIVTRYAARWSVEVAI